MSSNRPRRKNKGEEPVAAPKKGRLNNMEMLGIGLFCLAFLLYALSKCMQDPAATDITTATTTEEVVDSNATANNNTASSNVNNATAPSRKVDTSSFKNKLYITTDSLRIRKEPNISGELVGYLSLGEEVTDLGERTALEKIRVSVDEVRTAPWVKLKTADGKVGWAFGAYMQFYPPATETNMPTNEESSHQE